MRAPKVDRYVVPTDEQFTRVTLGILHARSGDRLTIKVTTALVATNAPALKRLVKDAVVGGVRLVELDLAGCHRADLKGLGELVSIAQGLASGRFVSEVRERIPVLVTRVHPDLMTQLQHYQLDRVLAIATAEPEPFHSPEAYA